MKASPQPRELAMRSEEFVELPWAHGAEGQAPTSLNDDSEEAESNYKNDFLVSRPIDPIIISLPY